MNLGETAEALLGVCDFSAEIFGDPSTELLDTVEGLDVQIYSTYQSI